MNVDSNNSYSQASSKVPPIIPGKVNKDKLYLEAPKSYRSGSSL